MKPVPLSEYLKTPAAPSFFIEVRLSLFEATSYCCPVHGAPIIVVEGFQTTMDILPAEKVYRAGVDNPNHIDIHYSTIRTENHDVPAEIVYCPVCELNYRRILEEADE